MPQPSTSQATLADRAHKILDAVCQRVGFDPEGARLLRLRSNAVFKLKEPIIVRIAFAPDAAERLPGVLSVTHWLSRQGFPTVRPTDRAAQQPIRHENTSTTFWDYVPTSEEPPTTAELGGLLRRLHSLNAPPVQVRGFEDPLVSVRTSLRDHPDALRPSEQEWLTRRIAELSARWKSLPFAEPLTLVHGDAWIDNLLRGEDGNPVLCDWDSVAIGPREWDLIHSYHGQHRFGLSPHDVETFTTAYGRDLRAWSGYPTLLSIRDIYAVGIHIRNAHGDSFSRHELDRRIGSLIRGEPCRWYMKPLTAAS
ncbi:phosphotransferase enzyme family protein [Spirillospora sp. CA-294931]|uniref:phosphotransferase enzyme family protein n=1 Tax=Spirillospora sp. CA-294931 TaxID=3240042 RepID=UPI003D8BA3EB